MELKNKTLTRDIEVRTLTTEQVENRQAEFVISTEAVDSHGTVFRLEGWDLTRYEKNPLVLYAHNRWDVDDIIGTGEVFVEGNELIGRVTFEAETVNPKAEKVFRKVQAGTLRMASIGANPTKGHWGVTEANEDPDVLYFDRQELLEFSIVPIGSNPDALKRNAQTLEEIKTAFTRNIEVTKSQELKANSQQLEKRTLSIREAQLINNKNR